MAKGAGINGLAVTLAAAGAFLVYAGIKDVSPLDGLRSLAGGKLPAGRPPKVTTIVFSDAAGGGSSSGGGAVDGSSDLVAAARKYLGTPYVFGGHAPGGFDCSGLVTWCLHRDLGIDLSRWPLCNNTHTVTGQFLATSALTTVARSSCQSGDLVCWPGHIGIAVSNTRMINAPTAGQVVREQDIWGAPVIRRMKSGEGTPGKVKPI